MVANTKQQEVFIINDIEMEINPSDIQVMDDNWVMEDSYLRSKAVFCYRSKYSATKVVLNIPFQISYLTEEDKVSLNNTYNCIKLISELNAYPFCFIKNNRIKSYISPTTLSVTDYMVFAVDEIAVVQDAKASNMVFLEVVLQYFNHVPLIKDFEFRSNLNVALNSENNQIIENIAPVVVNSLRESEVWKQYMNPRVKKVLENMTESGLLDYTDTANKNIHPMMGVQILAPTMSIITEGIEDVDSGRYVGKGTKIVTVTDTSKYDNGTFENLLATLTTQDFSFDTDEFKNTEKVQTINSENRIKQSEIVSSNTEYESSKYTQDYKSLLPKDVAERYKQQEAQSEQNKKEAEKNVSKGSKDVFIDWIGHDIQLLSLGIQKIEVRKKNRLVSHQIGSYKHPIVQYMGKYPLSVSVSLASTNFEVYQTDEPPVNVFIKQVLNILDYNRSAIPEAEAYNFIKIKSLGTFLFDCEAFLPSQSIVSASSNSQGLEQIVYSFNEGDLTDFIEQGKVEATGKPDIDKGQERMTDIIIEFLKGIPTALVSIINNSDSVENPTNTHILTTYKAILELVKEAMNDMTMTGYPQYEAITTAISYSSDLKPNNNVIRQLKPIPTEYTKELAAYKLYSKYVQTAEYYNKVVKDDRIDSKYSGPISLKAVDENRKKAVAEIEKLSKITTLQLHNGLVPFLVFILKTRSYLASGRSTKLPSVSYTPSGRFNNLALSILSKINTGIQNGAVVNAKGLATSENKEFLKDLTEYYAKTFFGYNIEDLDFEIFSPKSYDQTTDLLVPKVDPFFFLQETTILDGTEFTAIYERMYKDSKYNENLIKNMNETPNDEKGVDDTTIPNLGITYRRLQEIDFEALDTSVSDKSSMAGYAYNKDGIMGSLGPALGGTANPPSPEVIAAVEKALKKYGKDTDQGFRSYMYAVLLKESTNGVRLESSTGAMGLFQFTYIAVKDVIWTKNTTLEYSSGGKVGYYANPSSTVINTIKNTSKNDHYLNAQMFIERHLKGQGTLTAKGGVTDPVYSFIQHNIGTSGLRDVRDVLENGGVTIKATTKLNIKRQNASFIKDNDVQTVKAYYSAMARAMGASNVPKSLDIAVKESVKNTADKLLGNLSDRNKELLNTNKSKVPLVLQKKYIDAANKEYKEITTTKEDKLLNIPIGTKTMKGVVTHVKDGDTIVFKDTSTNKSYDVRVYGLDAPEIDHTINGVNDNAGEILGKEATKALTDLLKNKEVTLQPSGVDKHGRSVATVTTKDGVNVSLSMLRNGYAFLSDGFTTIGAYARAQEEAKKKQSGLWSYPDGVVTKPRSPEKVDLSPLTKADLENIKNNVNHQRFTEADLKYAEKAGTNNLNRYQPFANGQSFIVTSQFGNRIHPKTKKWSFHTGVDLGSLSGTTVVAASSGTVIFSGNQRGYGGTVMVDHGNGFVTLYAHLKQRLVEKGAKVTSQQAIAKSGGASGDANAGTSTGAHLHYEVRYNGKAINPFGTKELTLYKPGEVPGQMINTTNRIVTDKIPEILMTRKGVTKENTIFNEDKLADAIFENIYKNTNMGLKTAIPAIKVYMTIGNENDKFWLDTLKGDILYYEIKGIKSFHMNCNNDGNPVDTVVMSIADPSFLNTDGFAGISKMPGVNVNAIGTSNEMQFKNNRIQLKPGNKLHVRLGYGNSPSDLDIVFNGSIVDVEMNNQSLNLICEGFGKELLSEITATDKPVFMNSQNDNISTSMVLGESLVAETIEHFGYNSGFVADKFRDSTDPEDRALGPGRFSMSYNWFFDFSKATYKSRLFMNIFAPEIETLDNEFNSYSGWLSNIFAIGSNHKGGYPFAVYKMTPWQCMKQMEYRHPNTICKPMIYEDRMSLFYGIKEQMYFKKDLTKALQMSAAEQKNSGVGYDLSSYYGRRRERMAPVSNIHLVTSSNNLINNGLRLNSNYSTKIKVNYATSEDSSDIAKPWTLSMFEAKADDNLYPFDIRAKELTLSGCIGRYSAFLYGTTELKKEAEKMYTGKLLLIGNPSIKAGDYIFMDDSEKRMHGLVLVRECYHHFDEKNGFITEVVPGQYVEAANFMYSSLWLNLMCACKIVSSKMKTIIGSNFSSSDFNMVSDYLTVLRQAELSLDAVAQAKTDKDVAAIYASTVVLSTFLVNSLAKTLGLGSSSAIAKFTGVTVGTGTLRFTKNFLRIFVGKADIYLYKKLTDKVMNQASKGSGKVSLWLDKSKYDIKGLLRQPKYIIMSNKYYENIVKTVSNRKSGLTWKVAKPILGLSAKATISAAKLVGRALYTTVLAASMSNPLTIAIDAIVFMAINYAFAKIEEDKMMRQPLIYFPIVRHGKPYVGGMAGIVRNTWRESQLREGKKTIKEIQKAASILVGNNDVTNLTGDRPFYISLLSGIAHSPSDQKRVAPLYQNDASGNRIVVKDNKVQTAQEAARRESSKMNSYLADEDNMKKHLIQKMNDNAVGSL